LGKQEVEEKKMKCPKCQAKNPEKENGETYHLKNTVPMAG
jgi:Zn finger protein HypA/HybF involved in hydrogenase expression